MVEIQCLQGCSIVIEFVLAGHGSLDACLPGNLLAFLSHPDNACSLSHEVFRRMAGSR